MSDLIRALAMIERGHLALHAMEDPGPDTDTIMVALTERDLLLVGMALPVMELPFPCLGDVSLEFQKRLMELVYAQRPDWTLSGGEGQESADAE